jgi:hypothetical protein
LEAPSSLSFPEVTICNANPFQISKQEATVINDPKKEDELIAISQLTEEFILRTRFAETEFAKASEPWEPTITYFGLCWKFVTQESIYTPGDLNWFAGNLEHQFVRV